MCPKNDDVKGSGQDPNLLCVEMLDKSGNDSDRSIDMERYACGGCAHGGIGYRFDPSASSANEALKKFSAKVTLGEVCVGDCDNKTKLIERISGGSFGEVYRAEHTSGDGRPVAVKVEPQGATYASFLLQEGSVYRNLEGGPGIPTVYWFGYHGSEYSALVMDLLGSTLYDNFRNCNGKLSMKTVLMVADQMLATLQHVHSQGYVHRDISPSNFVFGCEGNASKLYLIDFGHAKKFNTSPFMVQRRKSVSMPRTVVGTPRFIGVHAHMSHQDAPRDDLEALGYMLVYIARGSLPWQGIKAQNMPEKLNKIAHAKMHTPVDEICQGLPEEFVTYLSYTRGLQLQEIPDYDGIRALFKALAAKLDITYDDAFDWLVEGSGDESCPIGIPDDGGDDKDSPNISPISR